MDEIVTIGDKERLKGYEENGNYNVGMMLMDVCWLLKQGNYTKDQILKALEESYDTLEIYTSKRFT
jgi:hypothetical protein